MPEPELDQTGRVKISLEDAEKLFQGIVSKISVPITHGQVVHTRPGVENPGVGELVISAETWGKRWADHAGNASGDWFDRAQNPSADPIAEAIKANQKRKDRLAQSERDEKWLKTMRLRNANDVFEGIQQAGEQAYKSGIEAKKAKTQRRINELRPKVLTLKQFIRTMSQASDADREKRMLMARRGMIAIGQGKSPTAGTTTTTTA